MTELTKPLPSKKNPNRDQAELNKFSQQASYWWDPKGPLWTLHAINPLRCGFIDSHVNVAEQKLLDVGCGAGLLSEAMAYRGAQVTGLDLSPQVLAAARTHSQASELTIQYIEQSVETFATQNPGSQDVVTCMEMLEHVPDPAAIIEAIGHILKPGGYGFFSTLNRQPSAFFQAILGAEYLLGIVPKGTHSYEKFIKPAELSAWCRSAEMELLDIRGLGYNPLFKSFSLTQKTNVNYLLAVRKRHA